MNDSPYCPACGTKRLGAFRFCRACRLDYDSLPADVPQVAPAPSAPTVLWMAPATGVAAWIAGARPDRSVGAEDLDGSAPASELAFEGW